MWIYKHALRSLLFYQEKHWHSESHILLIKEKNDSQHLYPIEHATGSLALLHGISVVW